MVAPFYIGRGKSELHRAEGYRKVDGGNLMVKATENRLPDLVSFKVGGKPPNRVLNQVKVKR